jgi:hypothetical protein
MKWNSKAQPYPDDAGVRARMLTMPVESPPVRATAVRRRSRKTPVDGCEACAENGSRPCYRHASCDPLATIGGDW